MTDSGVPGPDVDCREDLYRCLTTPAWWVEEEKRPSSAAFKQQVFSVDIASIAQTPEYTLRRFPPGCGLVSFNYGDAKGIGFVARQELDPEFPDNKAHANVYNLVSGNKRKTMAQELVQKVIEKRGVLVEPHFAS